MGREIRTINIEKPEPVLGGLSIEYTDVSLIEEETLKVLSDIDKIQWSRMSTHEISTEFSNFMSNLWKIHPFREGNTRTIITFCCKFAEDNGFPLDTNFLTDNADYLRTALVAASATFSDIGDFSKKEYLLEIIFDAIQRGKSPL